MAFFNDEHKQLSKLPRDVLERQYSKTESRLKAVARTGNEKALKQAMKEHGKVEYALLFQSTPEFQEKKKKYLRKNEIRTDLNPQHFNKYGSPHDALITARLGHKLKGNTWTHSRYVNGVECLDLEPDLPDNVPHRRMSPPFWQNAKQFGPKKGKASKEVRSKVKNYNKKFYQ